MSRSIALHKISLCGLRESNEDTEKFLFNLRRNGYPKNIKYAPIDFFSICDGHGGAEVSNYIIPILSNYLTDIQLKYPLSDDIIKKIYNNIQNLLIKHEDDIAKMCGSTAIVAIRYLNNYSKECVQIINLGDCRAVLSRNGLAIPLCKDHKPHWPDEKKRIDIINKDHKPVKTIYFDYGAWRIGDLSVSRSFGDLDNTPYVSHIPDIYNYQLYADDEFIIIACDGLWDTVDNQEAVNFVKDHIMDNNLENYITASYSPKLLEKSKNIAKKLAYYALSLGSTDNISIYIIIFNDN